MDLDVCLLTAREIIFEGKAKNIILPGEQGTFEVLSFHKRALSRLIFGTLQIDKQSFPIRRGIVKVNQNKVTILVEQR